jgi:hypothetical protein
MGPICEYYNECKNPATIIGLIFGYCIECKIQQLLWVLYVGIAMNVKSNDYYGSYMWVSQWM